MFGGWVPSPRSDGFSAAQNMKPSIPAVVPAPFGATFWTNDPVAFCNEAAPGPIALCGSPERRFAGTELGQILDRQNCDFRKRRAQCITVCVDIIRIGSQDHRTIVPGCDDNDQGVHGIRSRLAG
ncbi:hypothetical protein ACWCXB_20890 [Streptomyces sp. NPDC001514]